MEWIDPESASGESLTEAGVIDWVRLRLAEHTAGAVVRFGDGEARLLAASRDQAESMELALTKLKKETGKEFTCDAVFEIKAELASAFEHADVLGIRLHDRFSAESRKWLGMLHRLYADEVRRGRRPEAILAPCLLTWKALPELLADRRISAITCRDVKPVLEAEWGAREVCTYQVPSQAMTRDVDGDYEAVMHGAAIWPNRLAQLRRELTVREPGEVFLVGAGLFGKPLCIDIREKGGLALDLGSALDRIAGKVTRGPRRRARDLAAAGMSPAEIAADFSRVFRVEVNAQQIKELLDSAEERQ